MKIRPLGGGLLHSDGRTGRERERERVMTKHFAILRTVLRMVGYTLQKSCRNLVRISSDQYCLFLRTSVAWAGTITDCWPTVTGNVSVTVRQQQPGYRLSAQERWNSLDQCFSTFVRPRPGKFFFHKTSARSQQIYSSVPFQFFWSSYIKLTQVLINYGIIIKSINTLMCTVWRVDKYKIAFKLVINSRRISRDPV